MPAWIEGLDEYSGSRRRVTIGLEGAMVRLDVEATSGSNAGTALLTPNQARALAAGLEQQSRFAAGASEMQGKFDGERVVRDDE